MRVALLVSLLTLGAVPGARAQHHHGHSSSDTAAPEEVLSVHAGVQLEVGKATALGAARNYQGAAVMLGVGRGPFSLMAHVPVYRIEFESYTGRGLGDAHLMGAFRVLGIGDIALGISAGVMLPYGDDVDLVGMGHWMVMGGGFASMERGRVRAELALRYGTGLGGGGHGEHGVKIWPPVAPMNAREVRSEANVSVDLGHELAVSLSGMGALPIGVGEELALVGGELSYQLDRYRLAIGARHGLAAHTAGLVVRTSVGSSF